MSGRTRLRSLLALFAAALLLLPWGSGSAAADVERDYDSNALPASALRPAKAGNFEPVNRLVDRGNIVSLGAPQEVEFTADLMAPGAKGTVAYGRHPLVVFLHGAHPTCYSDDDAETTWPCPAGFKSTPSYLGYQYLSSRLATQGFASISVSANGINAQESSWADGGTAARGRLVHKHLQQIAAAAAGAKSLYPKRFAEHVDLDRVLVVGHSRGADGVKALTMPQVFRSRPYRILGMVSLAGTYAVKSSPPGTPLLALLPECDGDVFDLEGQMYIETGARLGGDDALRAGLWVPGANHNFLNTQWTPGLSVAPSWNDASRVYDDTTGDCGKGRRLPSSKERAVARSYVAAAARLWLRGESPYGELLDGTAVRPGDIGGVATRVTAAGGDAQLLERDWQGRVRTTGGMTAQRGRALSLAEARGWNDVQTPHWLPALKFTQRSTRFRALELDWSRRGRAVVPLSTMRDLRSDTTVQARIATDTDKWDGARIALRIEDARGYAATVRVPRKQLVRLTTEDIERKLWAQSPQVPIKRFAKKNPELDLSAITNFGVESLQGRGRLYVLDVWSRRSGATGYDPGLSSAVQASGAAVRTGRSYQVTVKASSLSRVQRPTQVWFKVYGYETRNPRDEGSITIPVGARSASATLELTGPPDADRLVVATYPGADAVNRADYAWLPVRDAGR